MLSDNRPRVVQQRIDAQYAVAVARGPAVFPSHGAIDNEHLHPLTGETFRTSDLIVETLGSLPVGETLKVADIGTGDGEMPRRLRQRVEQGMPERIGQLEVVGLGATPIDSQSPRGLELAASGVTYIQANVENISREPVPQLQGTDVMTSTLTVQWLVDPLATVEGLANHLAPGGEMWLQGGYLPRVQEAAVQRLEAGVNNQGHVLRFAPEEDQPFGNVYAIDTIYMQRGEPPVDFAPFVTYAPRPLRDNMAIYEVF